MRTNISMLLGLGALALLAAGCASGTDSSPGDGSTTTDGSSDNVATAQSKLAEIALGSDQKLEIYGLPRGMFVYKQSGPYGSEPIELPLHGYLIDGHGIYAWGRNMHEARRHLDAFEFLLACELDLRNLRR